MRMEGGMHVTAPAASGDPEAPGAPPSVPALADFVEPHLAALSRMLRGLLPTPEDAEDVIQETLVHAYVGMAGLRRMDLLGAWLRTIAYNRAMQWQRFRYSEQRAAWLHRSSDQVPGPEAQIGLRADMTAALGLLSPADRDAVVLRYAQGFTSEEIGRLQGEIASTIRWRLRRALSVLRDALADGEDGSGEARPDGRGAPTHARGHHPGPRRRT